MKRFAVILAIWLCALSAAVSVADMPGSVLRVRHGAKDDHTRIVLDLSSKVRYEIRRFENPERLAINLRKTKAGRDVKRFDISDGVVRRIRVNHLSWGTQVVLDLRSAVDWTDFFLAPVDDMPARIVLDLTPAQPSNTVRKKAAPVPAPARAMVVTSKRTTRAAREYVVAVDAGHGGKDPGAIGKNKLIEKHVALDLARRVASEIDSKKGFNAVLTRDRDVYLSLVDRTRIAKKKDADIFVSIHLNSAKRKSARGVEVFFLSPAGAEATANKLLKDKGTAAKELGLDEPENDDIMHMLVDVNQQAMMQRSSLLAEEILRAMKRRGVPPTRSIKQRSFAVLKSIDMPSVMVEAGFISNSKDASIFKSKKGKQDVAEAIASGVLSFLKKYPPRTSSDDRLLVHKVQRGDTLWKLSKKYGTTVASIRKSNRLGSSSSLRVGQELVIREGDRGQ
ncbi:MAG: N-acetylmuramoyl-L-alanine amidase [Candidatus Latescibacterota bacterium]|nr:MAG: N-acetylmuramoyl-L-alanine amidase [Candidatus Latescibacterota bacterium]